MVISDSTPKPHWTEAHRPFVPIGTDQQELADLADAILRGASIAHAAIENVGLLLMTLINHPDRGNSTELVIHGGEIDSCVCAEYTLDFATTFETRFKRAADFSGVTFVKRAKFSRACFEGTAAFFEATFEQPALFDAARFQGEVSFQSAEFEGHAWFNHATFSTDALFFNTTFQSDAMFSGAKFGGPAQFVTCAFHRGAHFPGAVFGRHISFDDSTFGIPVIFSRCAFLGFASFMDARFKRAPIFGSARFVEGTSLDARAIDVRSISFVPAAKDAAAERDSWQWSTAVRNALLRRFAWTTVRALGQLQILTRISIIALVAVPLLAGVWPAVRVAVNRYNHAIQDSSDHFDGAAARLAEIATAMDQTVVRQHVDEFKQWAESWRDRFGGMTLDDPALPLSLALAFFAAAFVTFGQVLYQACAPELVRKQDEDAFVDWMHRRYPEGALDRDDGLRRATDSLAGIARLRPDRNLNFVTHHGETVWIPPGSRIGWFHDAADEYDADAVSDDDEADGHDAATPTRKSLAELRSEGRIPGAERARIAIEEGARAEYWLIGRENLGWAWVSFACYVIALWLLAVILVNQAIHISRAAGWGWWGGAAFILVIGAIVGVALAMREFSPSYAKRRREVETAAQRA